MTASVYRQRESQNSPYYRCVEDRFEAFEHVYEERFERRYGFFRSYVKQVIYRYLDCGVLKKFMVEFGGGAICYVPQVSYPFKT